MPDEVKQGGSTAVARRVRRWLPLLIALAALAWVITIIVWITVTPVTGTGNPMD